MNQVYPYNPSTLAELNAQAELVTTAVREAVQEAVQMHKRLGNPVASWENGQVVWIAPEDIPGPNDPRQ